MKKSIVFRGIAMLLAVVMLVMMSGCVSSLGYEEARALESDVNKTLNNDINNKILNLKNETFLETHFTQEMLEVLDNEEKIMKTDLLDTTPEEYGYYYLAVNGYIDRGMLPQWYAIPGFGIPYLLAPLGIPTDEGIIRIRISLIIFDAQGEVVEEFHEEVWESYYVGLYYGRDPSKKYQEYYEDALERLLTRVSSNATEINKTLQREGTIIDPPPVEVLRKIGQEVYGTEVLTDLNFMGFPISLADKPSYAEDLPTIRQTTPSTSSTNSSTSSTSNNTTQNTLDVGVYTLSGSPLQVSLAYGVATISSTDYNNPVNGVGSYTISNGRITINYGIISGSGGYLSNKTYNYSVNSSTSFSGHGETWVRKY